MQRRRISIKYSGRQWMTLGGGALGLWSGYELAVRLEDFQAWTSGIRHLSEVRREPFLENLWIVFQDPAMGELGQKMAFLVITGLLGILCVALRNRPRADGVVLLAAVAAGVSGSLLGVYRPSLTDWLQTLKLLPLLLIIAGCAINLIQWHTDRRMDASRSRER